MPQTDLEAGEAQDFYNPFRSPDTGAAKHISSGYEFNQKDRPFVRMYNTSSSNHFAENEHLLTSLDDTQ